MRAILEDALKTLTETVHSDALRKQMQGIADLAKQTLLQGKKILICGNGGSAAEAQHIAAEFIGRFKKERKALPSIALTTDTSIITALSNDYSYDMIFARQIEGLGAAGDMVILLTTSGNSKNCLAACETAKGLGLKTVAFTGAGGGKIKPMADICFCVPSNVVSHIQEVHLVVLHAICEMIEEDLPVK